MSAHDSLTDRVASNAGSRTFAIWIIVVLAAPILVFGQTVTFNFVNYDDNHYVYEQPRVMDGLTADGVIWAFSSLRYGSYEPLVWLSYMVDVALFQGAPGPMHGINVLLHAFNAVMVLLLLRAWTGANGASVVIALLFALHPLRVESVAWISSRKDVLAVFFMLIALGLYTEYSRRPARRRNFALIAIFALGLLTKPTLVTFPLLLLLLDYWPLRRIEGVEPGSNPQLPLRTLLIEKIPLFALTGLACVLTLIGQESAGFLRTDTAYPLGDRMANAAVAYVTYLKQTAWPAHLVPFYPYPLETPGIAQWGVAVLCLVLISAWAYRVRQRHPYVLVGWLWYLVALIPVIGIVQVGLQSHADRYTYIPHIGVLAAAVLGVRSIADRVRMSQRVFAGAGAIIIALFAAMTFVQTGHWQNSKTLWEYTTSVDPDNVLAYYNLGVHEDHHGNPDATLAALQKVLEYGNADPQYQRLLFGPAHNMLAGIARDHGDLAAAINYYASAVRWSPNNAEFASNLGEALLVSGRPGEAEKHLRTATQLNPDLASAWNSLAYALVVQEKHDEALKTVENAVALEPRNADYRQQMAVIEYRAGRYDEALEHLEAILSYDAQYARAIELRNEIMEQRGDTSSHETDTQSP